MNKTKMLFQKIGYWFGVIIIGTVLGLTLQFAKAWTEPTVAPPDQNVGAPINTGDKLQTKGGPLSIHGSFMTSYDSNLAIYGGNVGIGTVKPSQKLEVNGGAQAKAFLAEEFLYGSDKTLKTNINPLDGSLDKILQLDGVSFNWKSSGEKNVGLIAQDVEKVYPELVKTNDTTGLKSVEYGNLVAPLIEAIKEQQKQIEDLQKEIELLKK